MYVCIPLECGDLDFKLSNLLVKPRFLCLEEIPKVSALFSGNSEKSVPWDNYYVKLLEFRSVPDTGRECSTKFRLKDLGSMVYGLRLRSVPDTWCGCSTGFRLNGLGSRDYSLRFCA